MTTPQLPTAEPDRPVPAPAAGLGLGYFIVRVRRLPGTAIGDVTGVVERLGTGEKRPFRNSEELAQVVAEWSG
jgi:hypothetical protein